MRYFSILFLVSLITSCSSPQKMFSSGIKKITKAIEKDPTLSKEFPTDTIIDIQIKTITGKDGKDSIIEKIKTVTLPCDFTLEDLQELQSKSRRELKYERKKFNDSLNHIEKMYKLETKRLEDSLVQINKLYRKEVRAIKDTNRKEEILARQETKQEAGGWFQRIFGRYWWILPLITLILGLIGGWYFRNLIPSIPNIFKRKINK